MSTLVTFNSCLKKKKRDVRGSLSHLWNLRKHNLNGADCSFSDRTYPHSAEIFNLLNPLYLEQIKDFSGITCYDYILVRDGFCSLVDFFYRFSRPGGCQTILLIHEELAFVVPDTWSKNILTYSIQRKPEHKEKEIPSSFYLCALSFDWSINSRSLHQEISSIKEYYGEGFNEIDFKIGVFLGGEPYPYQDTWAKTFRNLLLLVKEVCIELGVDTTFFSWEEIAEQKDFHKSRYYCVSEKHFIHAYSYIDHFFLSKRCMPFEPLCTQDKKGKVIHDTLQCYDIHINEYSFQPCGFWQELIETTNEVGVGGSLCYSGIFPYIQQMWMKYYKKEHSFEKLKHRSIQGIQEKFCIH